MDTGAGKSMLNLGILPKSAWTTHIEYFQAADGERFETNLITKHPVGIQFFPNSIIWTKIIGSKLHEKDLLICFDIYHTARRLTILPNGLKYKRQFQPYTNVQKIYSLKGNTTEVFEEVMPRFKQSCAESHEEFTHSNPLWKNKGFFITLPFKKNEDLNPTKATHPGMTPDDEKLAQQECSQLLRLGLIEPTTSNWACQAFYVNKRAEMRRGKKRLVIDYKLLNHFLADDKFPLPRLQNLFAHLPEAQWFSKFNLKAGFWQRGIQPGERYKTAFCISNAQFQWTVMPFGLKVAHHCFKRP